MDLTLLHNTLERYEFLDQREINSYTVRRSIDGKLFVCKIYGGGISKIERPINALQTTDDVVGVTRLVEIILERGHNYGFLHSPTKYTCLVLEALPDGMPIETIVNSLSSFRSVISTIASILWQLEIRGVRDMTLTTDSLDVDTARRVMLYGITDASFAGDQVNLCNRYASMVQHAVVECNIEPTSDIAFFVDDARKAPSMSSIVFHTFLIN